MRSMWNGMISFGLVNIPVGMYPATSSDKVSFNLLHEEDGGRIENRRVCKKCGNEVSYDQLVRGFEYEKGHYVTLTDEELAKAHPESTETIKIVAFVDDEEIDPIFFDKPYYLTPGKKSDRIYALLREALKESGKVGIAKFVLRSREYLAAVRARDNALVLETMHFCADLRKAEDAPSADEKIDEQELMMAKQLIGAMTQPFNPEQYEDTYEKSIMEVIEKKLDGKTITAKAKHVEATNVIDLMSRLKASLAKAGTAEEEAPAKQTKTRRSKASTSGEKKAPAKKTTAKKTGSKEKLRLVA